MLQLKKLFILFWGLTISFFSFASNPWDGLTNGQLAGNVFNSDSTGYTFNYGNLYPTSDLDPVIMNCIQSKSDINDVFDGADFAEFSTTEYNDTTIQGRGSIKYSFQDNDREETVSALFNEGNCGGFGSGFVKVTNDSKIRAMVKSSVDTYLTIYALTYSEYDPSILHDKLIFSKDKRTSVLLKKDQWTEVEFSIGNMVKDQVVSPSTIHGISYVFSNDIEGIYTALPNFDFYVDWVEVGENVGQKSTSNSIKAINIQLEEKYIQNIKAQNIKNDSTGYTFNFGTNIDHDSVSALDNNCLYDINDPNTHYYYVHNGTNSTGVSISLSKTESIDTNSLLKGALVYAFDGTQKPEGYVVSKFYQNHCQHPEYYNGYINLSKTEHRQIRAMVKTSTDAYFRIFAGMYLQGTHNYYTIKYNENEKTGTFNNPIALKANEWTEVQFSIQDKLDTFNVDFSKIIGVTFSVTNHQDEELATAFPVDLYIDWLEIGSSVGQKKTITNDVLANNNISNNFLEYNFSNTDTSNYSFAEVNCLPKDSISNHIYNITNQQNLHFEMSQNTKLDNDSLDGSLAMNFKNISEKWIINKFMFADCQPTTLDLTTSQSIELTVKSSQNIDLKVATVIGNNTSFYINDTLNSVSTISLTKDTWQTIQFDIPAFFGTQSVDLTQVMGIAFQLVSSSNQRITTNSSVELLVDQIKIGDQKVANTHEELTFNIYPNPANDQITIDHLPQNATTILYDYLGKQVITSNENSIDVSLLKNGLYFLHIVLENKVIHSQKIVKH